MIRGYWMTHVNQIKDLDTLCINTVRLLAVDMVEKAKSGHPGLPLGAASIGYLLYDRALRYNPKNPKWFNRDRFILSAGHGCAMQYALLHLTGFDLPLEELVLQLLVLQVEFDLLLARGFAHLAFIQAPFDD